MMEKVFRRFGTRVAVCLLSIGMGATHCVAAQQNQPLLQITSPAVGAIVNPGQTVTVVVAPGTGMQFTQIIAVAEDPIGFSSVATSSPFQVSLTIPANITPGPYHITALGSTGVGSLVQSDSVTVDIERSDTPSSLTSQIPKLIFDSQGEQLPLEIDAVFTGGSVVDVTRSARITFSVQDSSVAAVDTSGTVTALKPGTTSINVSYGQNSNPLQLTIPVSVPPPPINLVPGVLSFANQPIASTSAAQSIQLTNTSGTVISIKTITVTPQFAETDNCVSSSPLAKGGTCAISVTFTPNTNGTISGTISIGHSRGISELNIPLSGTGVGPAVRLSTTSLSFSNQQLGSSSSAQTLTLTNTGASGLSISSIVAPIGFSETDNCQNLSPIATNASCSINVAFTPTTLGITDGTLSISDNASPFPQTIALVGNGIDTIPPVINISTNPSTLFPPNGRTIQVTVSGKITDSGSGVNNGSATYAVTDSEGQPQPSGAVALGAGGAYSFTVPLVALRQGSDKNGRQYTTAITATDNAGNVGLNSAIVSVPHDQGH